MRLHKIAQQSRLHRKALCLAFLLLLLCLLPLPLLPRSGGPQLESVPAPTRKVVLVPLDGRPPCRQFVVDLGKIASLDVVVPPTELQDYYSQPGETKAMQAWLRQEAEGSDALIVSIDQLLYGGLLAAREKEAKPEEEEALLLLLRDIRAAHPELPIYAFSILPRLQPQDSIDGYQERRDIVAFARLVGKQAAGLPADEAEIERLRAAIPGASLARYLAHFEKNQEINERLIDLAKEGVITRLVLGQDDGEPYGIPNIEKFALKGAIASAGLTESQVYLTHGADELAATLLACHQERGKAPLRFYVKYAEKSARERIMPYMAISAEECLREKIELLGGTIADSPEEADVLLAVSANDSEKDTLGSRRKLARWIGAHALKKPTGLIDMSVHFDAKETVLPLLLETGLPTGSLAAYAGWNTMSNAAGTAVAESALFVRALQEASEDGPAQNAALANIRFVQNRILEDNFYLKSIISDVNHALKRAGYTNTADLDLTKNYRWANDMLLAELKARLAAYRWTKSFRAPFPLALPSGPRQIRLRDMTVDASFPWPRTFEIYLETTPTVELLPQGTAD